LSMGGWIRVCVVKTRRVVWVLELLLVGISTLCS
jgi:hypothetical protein